MEKRRPFGKFLITTRRLLDGYGRLGKVFVEMGKQVSASAPKRPPLRYHGGKWMLANWIIGHFPKHRIYVEPFGGGGSVLLRKPRSYAEVYNDLDGEVVNVFRILRDRGPDLLQQLELTPFARAEFLQSYEPHQDALEQARRTILRGHQGFGSAAICGEVSGFRANSNRNGTTAAHDWRSLPEKLVAVVERLRGVVIEQRPATEVIRQHDSAEALHYVDPPYVHSTRSAKIRGTSNRKSYKHELTDEQHAQLADVLHGLEGAVVLSGYRCPLYDELYADWQRIDKAARADGGRARIESLWLSKPPMQGQLEGFA